MLVRFKMGRILSALVKSDICELNLLHEEHDLVLVTLLFPVEGKHFTNTTVFCRIPEL